MLRAISNIIHRGHRSIDAPKRQIHTDQVIGLVRKKEPLPPGPTNAYKDLKTGSVILHPNDNSGANHILACQKDYKFPEGVPPVYYRVLGVFTSSGKPIDFYGHRITPEMVDSHLLNGSKTPQYFIKYPVYVYIRKSDVIPEASFFIEDNPQIRDYFETYVS